jgi:hypothetical protein
MRIERDTRMLAAQQRLPGALAGFDQLATQILAVKLRAGRKRKGMPPRWTCPQMKSKHRKSVLVGAIASRSSGASLQPAF